MTITSNDYNNRAMLALEEGCLRHMCEALEADLTPILGEDPLRLAPRRNSRKERLPIEGHAKKGIGFLDRKCRLQKHMKLYMFVYFYTFLYFFSDGTFLYTFFWHGLTYHYILHILSSYYTIFIYMIIIILTK